MKGHARTVTKSYEVLEASEQPLVPWHEGRKPYFLRIEPEVITGRRFVVGKAAVRRESLRPPARAGWWG